MLVTHQPSFWFFIYLFIYFYVLSLLCCTHPLPTVMTKQLDAAILVVDGIALASFQHKGTPCYPIVRAKLCAQRNVNNDKEMNNVFSFYAAICMGWIVLFCFLLFLRLLLLSLAFPLSSIPPEVLTLCRSVIFSPESQKLVRCSSL